MTQCPKCGHVRTPEDPPPRYECPQCGVVYAKAQPGAHEPEIPAAWRQPAPERPQFRLGTWIRRPIPLFTLILVVVLVALEIDGTWGPGRQIRQEKAWREATAKARQPLVSNSAWDGSVRQVEQYLRNRLHDPSSFEAVHWTPVKTQNGKHVVSLRYRAKNAFGALVINDATFVLDSAGNVLSAIE